MAAGIPVVPGALRDAINHLADFHGPMLNGKT
jgi:hypothetical protein